jgi:hypothetical protein
MKRKFFFIPHLFKYYPRFLCIAHLEMFVTTAYVTDGKLSMTEHGELYYASAD